MIKLLILDVDGVLTDGTKVYDREHRVITKNFCCKDFTAIKRFKAAGKNVIFVSGDEWNRDMALKRRIDFYCSRGDDLSLDKSILLPRIQKRYNVELHEIAFVGDDYFDLSIIEKLPYSFCPSDAPQTIKDASFKVLDSKGGDGVIVELYDFFKSYGLIIDASPEAVAELDKLEATSKEMT